MTYGRAYPIRLTISDRIAEQYAEGDIVLPSGDVRSAENGEVAYRLDMDPHYVASAWYKIRRKLGRQAV